MRRLLFAALLALPISAAVDQPTITIHHAWSRAAIAGREGVVYLTISNTGAPDVMTGVSTPIAGMAELHRSSNEGGVMKMRAVSSLPIGHDQSVTLAPGGYHVMLMDLKHTLKPGDSFPITVTFAQAGTISATVTVEKAGDTKMAPSDMSEHMTSPAQPSGKQP